VNHDLAIVVEVQDDDFEPVALPVGVKHDAA
jgi:hypothetical protein